MVCGSKSTLVKSMTHDSPAFKPRNIAVAGRELALAWADGHESYLPFDDLRSGCPCSVCRAQRDAAPDPLRIVKAPAKGQGTIRRLVRVAATPVRTVWT